ncbi:MAG TPA: thioredoxin [Acidimicrobiia bacterium]|nr:thioredoxin [Acidimicrobiia bacterium]
MRAHKEKKDHMAEIVTLNDDTFKEAISADRPILVDFWAQWCGPCHVIAPVLEEMATESDKITIGKLNIDHYPMPAADNDVMSIPTLILFKDGVEKKRIVGAAPKHRLLQELAEFL